MVHTLLGQQLGGIALSGFAISQILAAWLGQAAYYSLLVGALLWCSISSGHSNRNTLRKPGTATISWYSCTAT